MFIHVWDNHYSLIKIMGCLTHWWTHCTVIFVLSRLAESILKLLLLAIETILKNQSLWIHPSTFKHQAPDESCWRWWRLSLKSLRRRREYTRDSLPSLIWHVLVNSPGPSYKWILTLNIDFENVRYALYSVSAAFQIHTVYHQILSFFDFLHSLNIKCIISWLCPINKVKHRVKTCSFG